MQWISEPKVLPVLSVGFAFVGAIFFLAAFVIIWPIRKKVSLIATLVASSLVVGTFVVFNPVLSRRMIASLLFQSQNVFSNSDRVIYDTFGQQIIAALFRSPDTVALTIVVGSFLFGFWAAVCGLIFWYTDRKPEQMKCAAIENAKKIC